MNADIDSALADAETALATNDVATAIVGFREAGDIAVRYQLWRSAIRAYRIALELDLVDCVTVDKLVLLGNKIHSSRDWLAYRDALATHPTWPHVSCRNAQLVIGDRGAGIDCPAIGRSIDLAMVASNRIEARPDDRFVGMPLAMGLTIIHRAMWPVEPQVAIRVQITFGGHPSVWLGVVGGWESV